MIESQVRPHLIGGPFAGRPVATKSLVAAISQSSLRPHIGIVIFADGAQANVPWEEVG